jgi:uncharacterized cofD-like protein
MNPSNTPKIVVLGGGTGMPVVLSALKTETMDLTAIVTMSDDGGSSGRLSENLGVPPPGDIRNCLAALAQDKALMTRLLQYRFPGQGELGGHSLGNLILTALSDLAGGLDRAVVLASHVLAIRGRVLPVTLERVRLKAELIDGKYVMGESNISRSRVRIKRVMLVSENIPEPAPGVGEAIRQADAVILGPGSLFTSLIPTLLVPGVAEAIRQTPAVKIYIANLMTQPGETDHFNLEDHLRTIEEHAGQTLFNNVLVNSERPPQSVVERYAQSGAEPIVDAPITLRGYRLHAASLISADAQLRHDPNKLLAALQGLLNPSFSLIDEKVAT